MATIMDGTNPGTSLPEYGTADYWKKLQEAQAWAAQQATAQSQYSTFSNIPQTQANQSANQVPQPTWSGISHWLDNLFSPALLKKSYPGETNGWFQNLFKPKPSSMTSTYFGAGGSAAAASPNAIPNPSLSYPSSLLLEPYEGSYTTNVKSNAELQRQHPGWFDYLKPNVYGVLGNNAVVQKFNPYSPTFSPDTPFFTPQPPTNFGFAPATLPDTPIDYGGGGGGYVAPTYNVNYGGGGGGGGRRSSGGIGRSKQLASWYQAMTNWNINRPQSG